MTLWTATCVVSKGFLFFLYRGSANSDHISCPWAAVRVRFISRTGNRDDEWAVFALFHIDEHTCTDIAAYTHVLYTHSRLATVKKMKRAPQNTEARKKWNLPEKQTPVDFLKSFFFNSKFFPCVSFLLYRVREVKIQHILNNKQLIRNIYSGWERESCLKYQYLLMFYVFSAFLWCVFLSTLRK